MPYFERSDRHWWLTGFRLGDFANPGDLKMRINITFKDIDMCDAFANELLKKGYTYDVLSISNTTVNVLFDKPYSKRPHTRTKILDSFAQWRNKLFVNKYIEMTGGTGNLLDKINLLKKSNPRLYNRIIKKGFPKKVYVPFSYLKNRGRNNE
jgi:hypothetical protein